MAHEPILILDPDPISRDQLTDILTTGGYDVYGVVSADRLIDAVRASPFPLVMLDIWIPNIDRAALIHAIHEASPKTSVMLMGEREVFSWLLEVFRAGATDFVSKPFDPIELRERVDLALTTRENRLQQASTSPVSSANRPGGLRDETRQLFRRMIQFQDKTLEVFLDLERRNVELERRMAVLEHPSTADFTQELVLLVAHPDAAVSTAIADKLTYKKTRVARQAYTGGEVLDRVGQSRVDVLMVGSDLPDIPGTIVAQSVKAEYPRVDVMLLDTHPGRAEILILDEAGNVDEPVRITSQKALIELLEDRLQNYRDRAEARKFAKEFRGRHRGFVKSLATLKGDVNKALK